MLFRWRLGAVVVVCLALVLPAAAPAAADEQRERETEAGYLALGDSVAFGTNPLLDRRNADNFVGYPTLVAQRLELELTNASCPGEASGGFISLTGVDNVCRPYRDNFPLHVRYSTSQLDFAVAFLNSHRQTRLITINIGANDLFVLRRLCTPAPDPTACTLRELPKFLDALAANLGTIYGRLRGEAHFRHHIVGLTYYSTNYNDPMGVAVISAVNKVVAALTLAAGGQVADGFTAFKAASAASHGDPCAAGLLVKLPTVPPSCDIHPTRRGHELLAGAILNALDEGGD